MLGSGKNQSFEAHCSVGMLALLPFTKLSEVASEAPEGL